MSETGAANRAVSPAVTTPSSGAGVALVLNATTRREVLLDQQRNVVIVLSTCSILLVFG